MAARRMTGIEITFPNRISGGNHSSCPIENHAGVAALSRLFHSKERKQEV